jgi:hypothetical protein
VGDQKPPRSTADEAATVRALLQYQRESFVRKVHGIDDAAARRSPVASGTSLLWLTKHMAQAETVWVLRRFAGDPTAAVDDTVQAGDTIGDAIDLYRATWGRVDAVLDGTPDLETLTRDTGAESPVNLRWVLMHLLEETARHAGHADILRELVDGQTGR